MRLHSEMPGLERHTPAIATVVFMLVSAVSAIVREGWFEALIPWLVILATIPPLLIERWARIRIPLSLQLQYVVLLLAGPYVGGHLDLYQTWSPWDTVVHFYSGFLVGFAAVYLLGITLRQNGLTLPPWLEAVMIISIKALVALVWEIAEFIYDLVLDKTAQDDNFDTMTDMIAGLIPGILIAAALLLHRSKGWFNYLGFLLRVPPLPAPEAAPSRP